MRLGIRCYLCLLFIAAALSAQVSTQSIFGTLTDASGAVIPNVTVTATNVETNFSRDARTDSAGQYSIRFLPTGSYRVEVNPPGFKRWVQTGVVLDINRNARVDPVLEVGAISESVTVNADAPLVNTADATLGRTVTEVTVLPLVNRNVYQLLNLTPGVENTENTNAFGFPEQRTNINGSSYQGTGTVNYFLDGGNNTTGLRGTGNVAPNPDAVQEFRVITNAYGAEFGRFAGGVVDVITKSGTNTFHGSLFEFIRNDKLNANTWGALTRPPLRRNQFGGSFGGPVVKNRAFFFTSYSGLRQREQEFKNAAIVPTELERRGDFSASRIKPTDPLTRQPFPGGIIPAGRIDQTARNILDRTIPLANLPGNFYQVTQGEPYDSDEFQLKGDHSLSPTHQLTGSYFRQTGKSLESLAGNLIWSQRQFSWTQQNFNASDTWTIRPTIVNQLRMTYVRNFGGRLNLPEQSLADYGSNFRVQGQPSLPQITVSGFFTLGQGIAGPVAGSNYYGLREALSINRGSHTFKIGGEVSLEKFIHDTTLNNYGTFSFDGSISGSGLTDFVLGRPRTMNQDAPITKIDNSWYYGLFLQDDWRIHRRLILTVGLRYDLQPPIKDPHDRKLAFIAGRRSQVVPTAPAGLLFPGDTGIERGIISADKNNFAPRLGLAWDPAGDGKTSLRTAFGLFYGGLSGNEWNATADNQPFTIRQQFNTVRSFTDVYGDLPGGVSPFPYSFTPASPRFVFPAAVLGPSLDFRWPYTYQMNFSLQRQVFRDLSVEAAYVNALAHKLPFQRDLNYPVYGPGATAGNVNSRRPYLPGTLSNISELGSIMNTAYHGFQLSVDKRMSRGVQVKGYYSFSKSLEGARMQNDTTAGGAQNMNNLAAERGRTDNDRRHNVVASVVWQIQYFQNAALRRVLNGWMLSGIITLRSGAPMTVTSGRDNNLDGNNNDRANLVGNPRLDPDRSRAEVTSRWFNTAAFVTNPAGTDGTAGRNILDEPGRKVVDVGIFRDFTLREPMTLQFRAELTNAFNIVNLSGPTLNLTSAAFGTIRTARDMRQAQLGLRFSF
ncbi:MAG: carboxypeptidase regulatory-like domain-containing protein [Bryobacteraceae bacterium]